MARTVQTIKESITTSFMANETIATAYGFAIGIGFDTQFSKVSVESILFYIVSVAIYTLEVLFDTFKGEVNATLDAKTPHRPRWYRDKVLAFMVDATLVTDSDYYDTSGMSDSAIETAKVVKYAAVTESSDSSFLVIKVAGETASVRTPLSDNIETQLLAYINEVKDAGVRTVLINQEPERFRCEIDIYYSPMLMPDVVQVSVANAIKYYVENLPFNGEYSNMTLVDAIQKVEGVAIVEFKWAKSADKNSTSFDFINGTKTPVAGYFSIDTITLNMKAHGEVL